MHGPDNGDQADGEPEKALPTEAGEGGPQGLAEVAGSLQERLAAHGRKLADAAGSAEAEAEQRLGGLADTVEHFSFGRDGDTAAPLAEGERLAFDEPAHLPWLESADDDDDEGSVDTRKVAVFVAGGLALLAAIVGGIWWSTHRGGDDARLADGSVIAAPASPYKTAPDQPGGKTYDGTGASSFAVSQGHNPTARLAGDTAAAPAATPRAGTVNSPAEAGAVAMAAAKAAGQAGAPATMKPAVASGTAGGTGAGGVGVQVGAYTSEASAEAGWNKLVKQYAPLGDVHHRIVQGQADIGTVYRLQAVPGSESAATALCSALKGQGLACQVKH